MPKVDPIVVSGRSSFVDVPGHFQEVPPSDESASTKGRKFENKKAKITLVEISDGENGEKMSYTPKDGKCKIEITLEE